MGTVWVMFVLLNLFPMSKRAMGGESGGGGGGGGGGDGGGGFSLLEVEMVLPWQSFFLESGVNRDSFGVGE